jgi:hypothetical protein
MMLTRLTVVVLTDIVLFLSGAGPVAVIPFVDEATREPSLVAARDRVIDAINRQDDNALKAAMHPSVIGPGGFIGIENGKLLPSDETAGLRRALQLGGAFTNTRGSRLSREEFCAPFAYAKYPDYDDIPQELWDGFDLQRPAVVIEPNAPIYARPDRRTAVIARVSFELVQTGGEQVVGNERWNRVYTRANPRRMAWIQRSKYWDPNADTHACFGKFDDRWLMTRFAHVF